MKEFWQTGRTHQPGENPTYPENVWPDADVRCGTLHGILLVHSASPAGLNHHQERYPRHVRGASDHAVDERLGVLELASIHELGT